MGYLGFGLRKEVYQRKGKKPFRKVRDIYGENMESIPNRSNHKPSNDLSEIFTYNAKKNKRNRIRNWFFNTFITLALTVFILFVFHYVFGILDPLF
ncbi:MAG: hypothetical protein AAGF85_17590 [Bacteroidota bacterium]